MKRITRRFGELGSLLAALVLAGACATNGMQRSGWQPQLARPPERDDEDDWTPVALSVIPGIQAFSGGRDVRGLRFALTAGVNRNVSGIDLTPFLISMSLGNETGIQATGGLNIVTGNAIGIQLAGTANRVDGSFAGIQTTGFWNIASEVAGAQVSGVISTTGRLKGIQVSSLLNLTADESRGTQIGGINLECGDFWGLQMGLVNWGESMKGVQVGLLNFNRQGFLPVFPLINFSFRGEPFANTTENDHVSVESLCDRSRAETG